MPNLWKFISKNKTETPNVQEYTFSPAESTNFEPEEEFIPKSVELDENLKQDLIDGETPDTTSNPLAYAQVQSDLILEQARNQAEQIIREAREQAVQQSKTILSQAEEVGYQAGFQKGMQDGTAKALEEGAQMKAAQERQLAESADAFIKNAEAALSRQLNDNLDELRDLSIAIAEKVICTSLKSSSDVISKMIQMAVDKRKRCEWVHVYIAECDARRMTTLPPALANALAELSDHVRIIPMVDEESGTCIVECPGEIIDASASTQVQNVRNLLNATPVDTEPPALFGTRKG